jgi:hypothetical protein
VDFSNSLYTAHQVGGEGGNAPLVEGGAKGLNALGNGNNARYNACGGGGAWLQAAGKRSGGSGGQGLLIIDEYS